MQGYRPIDKSRAIPSLRSEETTVNLDARLRYYRSWRVDVPEAKKQREDDDERISTFVQPNGSPIRAGAGGLLLDFGFFTFFRYYVL